MFTVFQLGYEYIYVSAAVLTPSSPSSKVCLDNAVNVISEVDQAADMQWWQATYVSEFHLQLLWFRLAV
jgi:hypothetical protein